MLLSGLMYHSGLKASFQVGSSLVRFLLAGIVLYSTSDPDVFLDIVSPTSSGVVVGY